MRSFLAPRWFDDMDRWFDDIRPMTMASFNMGFDTKEGDDHILLSLDVPGMKKSDLKVELNGDMVTVSGERKNRGFIKRSFTLPSTVDASGLEAHYEDGVLDLYLPKVASAKVRRLEIQSGKGGFFSKLKDVTHSQSKVS